MEQMVLGLFIIRGDNMYVPSQERREGDERRGEAVR